MIKKSKMKIDPNVSAAILVYGFFGCIFACLFCYFFRYSQLEEHSKISYACAKVLKNNIVKNTRSVKVTFNINGKTFITKFSQEGAQYRIGNIIPIKYLRSNPNYISYAGDTLIAYDIKSTLGQSQINIDTITIFDPIAKSEDVWLEYVYRDNIFFRADSTFQRGELVRTQKFDSLGVLISEKILLSTRRSVFNCN
jgi:hypothetical protein